MRLNEAAKQSATAKSLQRGSASFAVKVSDRPSSLCYFTDSWSKEAAAREAQRGSASLVVKVSDWPSILLHHAQSVD